MKKMENGIYARNALITAVKMEMRLICLAPSLMSAILAVKALYRFPSSPPPASRKGVR
jgi:hypothetical protein